MKKLTSIFILVLITTNLFGTILFIFKEGEHGIKFCTSKEVTDLGLDVVKSIGTVNYDESKYGNYNRVNGKVISGCDESVYQDWLNSIK